MDIEALKKEVVIEFYRSSGPGGQRKDKKETAVRLRHIPSGITVTATERRSQALNIRIAFKRLLEKLRKAGTKKKKRIISIAKPHHIKERILKEKRLHSEKKRLRREIIE